MDIKKISLWAGTLIILLILASRLGGARVDHTRLEPEVAQQMMATQDVIILDVRTDVEFATGNIPGAIHLPLDILPYQIQAIAPDTAQTILVYCLAGQRSDTAARRLTELGYTNVYDFGGIVHWPGEIVRYTADYIGRYE